MGIKRYFASKDNTITNAFKANLTTRGTGSNMGASDILEAFVIHGQTSASINADNAEQSRILLQFDLNDIESDITSGIIPSSSVDYKLVLYNAPHGDSVPLSYSLDLHLMEENWTEGNGLDMESYTDLGASNWIKASTDNNWTGDRDGGWYNIYASSSYFFSGGLENLELDVTFAIDRWRQSGSNYNYGFLLKHSNPVISGSEGTYYTKKFFSRTSEFYFKRPILEARWDSTRKDNRGNFFVSSSLADSADNLNTLFLYNTVRGQLKNIPNLENDIILMNLFSGSETTPSGAPLRLVKSGSGTNVLNITGGVLVENGVMVSGVYTASFATTSSLDNLYDIWFTGSAVGADHTDSTRYFTGSVSPYTVAATELIYNTEYVSDITNLASSYIKGQKPRLRLFARKKDWNPNIYTVATADIVPEIIENAYYRLTRDIDNMEIIPFGTGSNNKQFTRMSYDISGNYFELDTSYLEPGYAYKLQLMYNVNGTYDQQPEEFKFRVEEKSP
jgi:hypothetical protein